MPTNDRAKPAFLALSCVGFIASATSAQAQDAAPPASSPPPEGKRLGGVTVTGTAIEDDYSPEPANNPKFVAPLLDTPRSVTVLPAKVIKDTGSATLADALRTVPGITFGAAEGGNPIGDRPFIRGFDAQGSTYIDGSRDLGSQTREVFDIDQVQIIRGSDSVMFGRGSAGGTINIISKLPTADDFIDVDGTYGSGDYKRITLDANRKLSDTVAVRLAGMWHDQDVVGRDAIWQKRWGIAPSITVGLGTPTRLTASYYHLHTNELPDSGIPFEQVCNTAAICNIPPGHTDTAPAHHFTTANGRTGTVPRGAFYGLKDRDFRHSTTDIATVKLEHDFGAFTLANTLRYGRTRQAYIYTQPDDTQGNVFNTGQVWRRANTRYGWQTGLFEQLDLKGKFKTGSIEHSVALGAEMSWEKARRGAYVLATGSTVSPRCSALNVARYNCTDIFDPSPNDPWINYTNDTAGGTPTPITKQPNSAEIINKADSWGIYGFDSITLMPSLIVNLGARVDHFHSKTLPAVVNGVRPTTSRSDTIFTYQAGLVFKPSADSSLYFSYSTAATPPNSLLGEGREDNALGSTQVSTDDLKVTKTRNIELGAKALVFRERLSITADIFRTDTDNARVTDANGNPSFIGKTRNQGFELGFNGNVTERWNIFGGYTYLDAKVVDGGLTVTTLGNVRIAAPAVLDGKQVPLTARHNFTLSTTYKVMPKLTIGGGAYYTSRVYSGYGDDRHIVGNALVITRTISRYVPGYVRFDANAAYSINDHIELRLNVQNLTNKRYFPQVFTNHYASQAPGRTILGTVGLHF